MPCGDSNVIPQSEEILYYYYAHAYIMHWVHCTASAIKRVSSQFEREVCLEGIRFVDDQVPCIQFQTIMMSLARQKWANKNQAGNFAINITIYSIVMYC